VTVTEIWAAIDIHLGQVVSLRRGRPEESTIWNSNPIEVADRWQDENAYGLHLVDLNAALGDGSNRNIVESILHNAKIPIQIAGGIRGYKDAKRWLAEGATRVVLGTLAYENPSELHKIIETLGAEKIVVAVDYRNETIVTHAWKREQRLNVHEAIRNLQAAGIKTVLATATELDGMATGPDLDTLRKMRNLTSMHILASGGIRTINDVHKLQQVGVDGVIAGRALYEGTLRLVDVGL
jgi:phosphoribosylformimino-5-aminoimidazole carboxamide ribotide isomerase